MSHDHDHDPEHAAAHVYHPEKKRGFLRNRISRRGFARTLGVGALALPFLRTLRGEAQPATPPKRFIVFFSPNGTIPDEWVPDGGERDFRFRRILEPLEPFREHVCVIQGLDQRSTRSGPGDGHQKGMGHILTGTELLSGDTGGGCDSCAPVSWAGGISIDQRIANHIGTETPFRSVELAAKPGGSNVWTRMCYRGAGEPIPPEASPFDAFDRLFAGLDMDPFGLERRRRLEGSVLDAVQQDFAQLQSRLGSEDRARLEVHLDVVRDLERRLDESGSFGASCRAPEMPGRFDVNANENFRQVVELQMDVLVAAMACDLTRVGSLQWTRSVGQMVYPWLGFGDRHHDLSHEGDGNTTAQNKITEINRWYAEVFAGLLARLQAVPEGDGTLLDNTVVVWVNELGKGNSHTRNDMPFVLGGSAGGALTTGRFLRMDRPHNDLLLTLARAFGIDDATFGNPEFNTGVIDTLLT
ncbi:MAG TPA: DUF1552 domain-containing protein [Polyangiaceae bacterium LLY-WYZ-15_(1-7)]|nr:DUF1552 domain-containing protein [Polyangiaceae bacterium LLY-WYZ-15_(1-7)]HJL03268.1 DUF1552 domain-containing protein [Polyangiaceae bacterium LLY-WYZ-15_(1-7)]HJL11204.1 DUF1552 domain-containing protein [Polyangiaceae bacterium LLY-WYZ-15_(1-7)]HJL25044.1 DUF1552 domain-containing protein [Polyangiaceae bacterium LLY-WYZ-15_(1-7)]HJL36137.1 DUF1552 domain-containing protein [Polyangiaceae bacterium LLY-WYZ-15_(1-7)]